MKILVLGCRRRCGAADRENHSHAVALHFMYYNFVRVHQTLKVTPAMEAGLTNRLWDIKDLLALVDANEEAPKKRGPYKKRISK